MSLKSKLKKAGKAALVTNPLANVLYTGGAALNKATGGTGPLLLKDAVKNKAPVQFSTTTQAFSGYQGAVPNQGRQGLPLVNAATPRVVGQVATTIIREAVAPAANEVSKGLFGVSLKTVAWTAAGAAVGLGGIAVATR